MTLLIILLPLFSSLISIFFGYKIGRIGAIYISISSMILTVILSLKLFWNVALQHNIITVGLFSWFSNELFLLDWIFLFDSLSVTMLIVVTIISLIVHIYSTSYMSEDPQLPRFLSYLSLFTFFMLILITSNNFLQLFMGWEGVGLCSYLLISFWYTRISAGKAAMKAIVLNRIGDCGLLLAIFAIFLMFRTLEFSVIFAITPFFEHKTFMFLNYEFNLLNFIAFFLLVAAIGKSAQIGLHTWLPDAMEGPTPVSALIHAATMVTAGVFLIIRCSPIFEYTPSVLLTMTIIGSLTSIFAASAAIVQHDIKKTVAYSTCSQLGYMVFCCGLSNYPVSLYHLVTHAFFKALLFLSAGAVIHALLNEQDIRKMGGLAKLLPFSFVMMLIGSLALSGFPFLAGFYSKDLILETTIHTSNYFQYFVIYTSFLTALLTAIYSFRTLYIVFLAPTSVYKTTSKQIHEVPPIMAFSLLVLALGSIFSGYFFFDMFVGLGSDFFENSLFIHDTNANTWISIEYLNPFFKQLAPFFGIIGIFIAISLLKNHSMFLTVYKSVYNYYLYKFLTNKWYFDNVYSSFSTKLFYFNYYNIYNLLDKGIFEFLGPRGSGIVVSKIAGTITRTQSGYIWHYMCLMALFLLASISLAGSGVGIGVIFAGLIQGVVRSPKQSLGGNCFVGKRFFSQQSTSSTNNRNNDNLESISLPNVTVPIIVLHSFYGLLLLLCFIKQEFFFAVSLEYVLFFVICIYYVMFKHNKRFRLFWNEIFTAQQTQPFTLQGLFNKWKILIFGWWVSVMHLFFYTQAGYIIWSTSTTCSLIYGAIMFQTQGFIPIEIIFLWGLSNLGLSAVLTCYFIFWLEKKRPFFYLHINKKIVLLLVENPGGVTVNMMSRLAGPLSGGALGAFVGYLTGTVSNDRARVSMYEIAAKTNLQLGLPAPSPTEFLRTPPSITGSTSFGGADSPNSSPMIKADVQIKK